MKEVTLEERKKILLDVLVYIDDVCREHDINYSLASGTLLGAIRHKGFIPWDDDIDIMLLRKDYNKLLNILSKQSDYTLITIHSKNYYLPFAKLCDKNTVLYESVHPYVEGLGVFVDIFPVDNLGNSVTESKAFKNDCYKKYLRSKALLPKVYYYSPSLLKKVVKFFLYTPRYIINKLLGNNFSNFLISFDKKIRKKEHMDCAYVGFVISVYGDGSILNKDIYNDYIYVQFEGKNFKVIKEYDAYLKGLYKDYMKLPPEETQVTHHVNVAYWINSLSIVGETNEKV